MNDVPIEVIVYLKENTDKGMDVFSIKCKLMNELNLRGKEAKKYAKWYVNGYLK